MFTRNAAALPLFVLLSVFNCEYNNDKNNDDKNNNVQSFASTTVDSSEKDRTTTDDFVNYLNNYNGNEKNITVENKDRGGNFRAILNNKLQDDYGVIFPYENKGKGWHWVRENTTDDSSILNIKWYGAKGIGLEGYKADSAAFTKAVAALWRRGGGKLYIPTSTSFYGFNGDGLLLPDNTEIYGDGPKSQIKHVNPGSGTYYRGAVFYTTTYGPVNVLSIMREPVYPIQDAEKNQNFIAVKNNADASKLKTGELIGLGAGFFLHNEAEKKSRYTNFEINEITQIEGNKIYLKYPTSVPLKTSPGSNRENNKEDHTSPVIIDVNGNHTYNDKLKAYDRISKNIYIHDLYLSQADYNMIDNTPYPSNVPPPSPIIALGGTFESRYNNLILDSYGTFGGNLFNRCDIGNLTIYAVIKLTDLGYGSANTKMHDIKWQYKQSKIVDTNTIGFVYLNDGTHDIELSHITATGDWDGKNLFVINGGGHNINIHDVDINLPKLRNLKSTAILIRDENAVTYSHDITFRNVNISIGGLKQFIEITGTQQLADDRKIVFDNVAFNGSVSNLGRAISIANSPYVTLSRIKMSQGNIFLDNAASAKIDNLDAPESNIINRNGRGQKPQVVASKFKRLMNNNQ